MLTWLDSNSEDSHTPDRTLEQKLAPAKHDLVDYR